MAGEPALLATLDTGREDGRLDHSKCRAQGAVVEVVPPGRASSCPAAWAPPCWGAMRVPKENHWKRVDQEEKAQAAGQTRKERGNKGV